MPERTSTSSVFVSSVRMALEILFGRPQLFQNVRERFQVGRRKAEQFRRRFMKLGQRFLPDLLALGRQRHELDAAVPSRGPTLREPGLFQSPNNKSCV